MRGQLLREDRRRRPEREGAGEGESEGEGEVKREAEEEGEGVLGASALISKEKGDGSMEDKERDDDEGTPRSVVARECPRANALSVVC